jgi:hypothetical protein
LGNILQVHGNKYGFAPHIGGGGGGLTTSMTSSNYNDII